jgi:hypothetical protein
MTVDRKTFVIVVLAVALGVSVIVNIGQARSNNTASASNTSQTKGCRALALALLQADQKAIGYMSGSFTVGAESSADATLLNAITAAPSQAKACGGKS